MKKNKLTYGAFIALVSIICIIFIVILGKAVSTENGSVSSGSAAVSGDQPETTVVDLSVLQTLSRNAAVGVGSFYDEEEGILPTAGFEKNVSLIVARQDAIEDEISYWGYSNLGIAVVDNHLNIRETPVDGKLVGKMSNGAACEILDVDEEGWAHIKSGKVEGYVSTEYLLTGAAGLSKAREVIQTMAEVNTTSLRVREQPNTDAPVITLIPRGEEVLVTGYADGWVQFELDDELAYVSSDYVTIEEKLSTAITMKELYYGSGISDTRVNLVEYAKKFVGNPYVWGGTSLTKGCDCSGFVLSVYKNIAGISLPHHAASQATKGKIVTASTIRPGDLIFYSKGGKINHVGIYIGNGQVCHASSPKTGIKISSMYYRTPAKMVSLLD